MASMDNVWLECRTISSETMENIHDFFSSMSMDFFHGAHGNNPWTLSMDSMEIIHIVHGPLSSRLCSVDPDKSPESQITVIIL